MNLISFISSVFSVLHLNNELNALFGILSLSLEKWWMKQNVISVIKSFITLVVWEDILRDFIVELILIFKRFRRTANLDFFVCVFFTTNKCLFQVHLWIDCITAGAKIVWEFPPRRRDNINTGEGNERKGRND